MKLQITTFMPDYRRPTWLIWLLYNVNAYVDTSSCGAISQIRTLLDEKEYVKRNSRYKICDCVEIEEKEDELTLRTVFKHKDIVTFKLINE